MGSGLNWLAVTAVGGGAAIGAWLRWGLGLWLSNINTSAHTHVQAGTLAANLIGGYLIGMALGFFSHHPHLSPEWRLFVVTGFLGGLTTFSSFSAESMVLLQRGDYGWALAHTLLHLVGALLLCIAGFATWRALRG
ncbi:fluoride efflux transporter CrcB [Massilia niabensis]|uniref:Fluoride-specific ion channel FluC n=1 Tax=Massilia niabensis TaxID=544910 RepID=A0ABW0L9E1_9BURK